MNNKKIEWINSLKFIACIGIFWNHFFDFFVSPINNKTANKYFSKAIALWDGFGISLDPAVIVRIFVILSGFLAGYKVITSFKELIIIIIKRYVRFVIPLLVVGLTTVLLNETVGFHYREAGDLLNVNHGYYGHLDSITITEILNMVFVFNEYLNGPVWTIMPIFIGTILIYILNYIFYKIGLSDKKTSLLFFAIFFMMIIKYNIKSLSVASCVFGAGINRLIKHYKVNKNIADFAILLILFMLVYGHMNIYNYLVSSGIDVPVRFDLFSYGGTFWGGLLIYFIYYSNLVKKFLESNFLTRFNNSSLTIYLFHEPIKYSFSMILCMALLNKIGYGLNCFLTFVITLMLLICIAQVYVRFIDKFQVKILKYVENVLEEVL